MELRALKTKAAEAFAKGKFAKAADLYSDYCESDPRDLHARLRMGDAWAKSGKKEKAIVAYKSAAEGFARDGFLPRAIAASKLILELDPKHQGMQQMLADLYARKSGPAPADRPKQPPPPSREARAAPPAKPAEKAEKAASSSFADRKDAIELPEYEIPRDEPPKPAPKVDGPSPMNRKDAIELPPDDSDRGPRQVLDVAAIELTLPPAPKAAAAPVGALEVEPPEELTEFEEIEVEDGTPAQGGKEIEISVEQAGGKEIEISIEHPGHSGGIEISVDEPLDRSAELPPELQLDPKARPAAEGLAAPAPGAATPAGAPAAAGPAGAAGASGAAPGPGLAPAASSSLASSGPAGGPSAGAPAALVITAAPAIELPTAVVAAAVPAEGGSGAPPGMKPRRAPEVEFTTEPAQPGDQVEVLLTSSSRKSDPAAVAAPTGRPAAPAAPPSRIWLPPGFGGAPTAPSMPEPAAAPAAEGPAPSKKFRSDREAGLAALSKFSELDIDLDAPPPPEAAPVVAPPAVAPAVQEPRRARPAGVPSFTELELEGDSLLHAVETAAQAGIAQRGGPGEASGAEEGDGVFDDPGDMKQIPLFSDLPPDAFIELFERCPLRRLAEGERIIEQGSLGDAFYVICEGSVRVYREEDGERRPIATLTDGAFFGEMALLSGAPRTASVESASDETQLLEISAPVLAQLSHRYPQVARALKKFCRQRLLSNVMNSSPLFQPFSRDDRRSLVARFRARDVSKGEPLVKEGERSDGMYIVLSGEVEVVKGGTRLALLKEGDLFGEMSLLSKSPATATVAASKHTSLLRLPREDFDELILSHPQILVLVSELTDDRRRQTEAVLGGAAKAGEEGLLLV